MPMYDFVLDKELIVISISDNAVKNFGSNIKKAVGKNIGLLIKKEYKARVQSAIIAEKKDFFFIEKSKKKWVFAKFRSKKLSDNTFGVSAIKVSPFIQQETINRFSELTAPQEPPYDIYYTADIYGNITSVSESVSTYSGFAPEELIGKNLSQDLYVYPELRNTLRELIGQQGNVVAFDTPLYNKNGSVWWVSTTAHFVKNSKGEIVGIEGATKDITKHKQKQENHIESIEQRYKALFSSATDAIFFYDLKNKIIVDANQSAAELTGYSVSEMKNMPLKNMYPIYEHERIDEALKQKIKNTTPHKPIRFDFLSKSGEIVPTEVSVSIVLEDGQKYSFEIVRDITSRLLSEKRKREQEQMLVHQSKLASMGTMISNIAHQWRQPLSHLSGILMNFEFELKQENMSIHYADELIQEAFSTLRFMSNTIDDFKNFYSSSKPKEMFLLKGALQEVLTIIEPAIKFEGIEIAVEADKYLKIETYRSELCHVLLNLIQNAKDVLVYRKIEKPKITINAFFQKKAVIIISDNAGGIEEDILDRIFDPYFTTKPDGQGIGLYMSKVIIEKNIRGKLSVKNTTEGAEFKIKI